MIEPKKEYKTRNGLIARVDKTNARGPSPIRGAILCADGTWMPEKWRLDGKKYRYGTCYADLCLLGDVDRRKIWVVALKGGVNLTYDSRSEAVDSMKYLIVPPKGIVELEFNVTQGEGL